MLLKLLLLQSILTLLTSANPQLQTLLPLGYKNITKGWSLSFIGTPLLYSHISREFSTNFLVTQSSYALVRRVTQDRNKKPIDWSKNRKGNNMKLHYVVVKSSNALVVESEQNTMTTKLFDLMTGRLLFDYPFTQAYDPEKHINANEVFQTNFLNVQNSRYPHIYMKDQYNLRIFKQAKLAFEFKVEENQRIEGLLLPDINSNHFLMTTIVGKNELFRTYKFTSSQNIQSEIEFKQEKQDETKMHKNYAQNIGLMMFNKRKRITQFQAFDLKNNKTPIKKLDQNGFFYAAYSNDIISTPKIQKIFFSGTPPLDPNNPFQQMKQLYSRQNSSKCQVQYNLIQNQSAIFWIEYCITKQKISLEGTIFSLKDYQIQKVIDTEHSKFSYKWTDKSIKQFFDSKSKIVAAGVTASKAVLIQIQNYENVYMMKLEESKLKFLWSILSDLSNILDIIKLSSFSNLMNQPQKQQQQQHKSEEFIYKQNESIGQSLLHIPQRYFNHANQFLNWVSSGPSLSRFINKDENNEEHTLLIYTSSNFLYSFSNTQKSDDPIMPEVRHVLNLNHEDFYKKVKSARLYELAHNNVLILTDQYYSVLNLKIGEYKQKPKVLKAPTYMEPIIRTYPQCGETAILPNLVAKSQKVVFIVLYTENECDRSKLLKEQNFEVTYQTKSFFKHANVNKIENSQLWKMTKPEANLIASKNAQVYSDSQILVALNGPNGQIIRKYINPNLVMNIYQINDSDLEVNIMDTANGNYLYQKTIEQSKEPLILIDENVFLVKYKKNLAAVDQQEFSTSLNEYDEQFENQQKQIKKKEKSFKHTTENNQFLEEVLVIQMMEPFKNETIPQIVNKHIENVGFSIFGTVEQHKEKISSYTRDDPIIDQLTYILPFSGRNVISLAVTKTEKGITGKQILFGTDQGQIIALPKTVLIPSKRFINKNKYVTAETQPPAQGEAARRIPYDGVLLYNDQMIINQDQSIAGIQKIYSFPTSYESTSIVVSSGSKSLMLRFYAPDKTFDKLSDKTGSFIMIGVTILSLFVIKGMKWYVLRRTKQERFLIN